MPTVNMSERDKTQEEAKVLPEHVGFIMDGNGRWAKRRGMPREYGHKFGAQTFEDVMDYCCHKGIRAMTFYVFSTENWKRPKKEVDAILHLLDSYLDTCRKRLAQNDVRFVFIGDRSVFSDKLRDKMDAIEAESAHKGYTVYLALNYGGRSEIVHAVNALLEQGRTHVTEEDINACVYTAGSPEPDLIVRTGGDLRISNFLLWQSAYAELYFTDVLWPDFKGKDVDAALDSFAQRKRRFGGV